MFTCGRSRRPAHREDCPSMPVGCPKNDRAVVSNPVNDTKNFLFIDSGHFPFSHKGKVQIAEMLLQICIACPDYRLVVKPRFLPEDTNMLHENTDHLYTVLSEQGGGELPDNLVLLQEHRDMQELLDMCSCVIMLCTSAYVDAALRGRCMLIIKGLDNEDKYELRNDIEYKNSYALREQSGCVVDYREVLRYLPAGLRCREEHLNEVVACRSNASGRIVDVMEYIDSHFLARGLFPAIREYSYETYRTAMRPDPGLTWETIKRKRVKNMGNDTLSVLNRIVADIDFTPLYEMIDRDYENYPADVGGANAFIGDLQKLRRTIVIENQAALMDDPLNQAELFRAMYQAGLYAAVYEMPEDKILCRGPWHYYVGTMLYREKSYEKSILHFLQYIREAGTRTFAKYECENRREMRGVYEKIAFMCDAGNVPPSDFAEIFEELHARKMEREIPYEAYRQFYQTALTVSERLYREGQYRLAARCALRCMEQRCIFDETGRQAQALQSEKDALLHSPAYGIGRSLTWIPRQAGWLLRSVCKNGFFETVHDLAYKIQFCYRKTLVYQMGVIFHQKVISGYKLYAEIIRRHGDSAVLLLSGYAAGDAYVYGLLFNDYVKRKYPHCRSVFGVYGASGVAVGELFGVKHMEALSADDFKMLYHLLMFVPQNKLYMESMHYHGFYRYTGILNLVEGLHGSNYLPQSMDFLGVDSRERLTKPVFNRDETYLDAMFCAIDAVPGKTVVLAPYAKSVKLLPEAFWKRLADLLRERGFCVCTNAAGDREPPVEGTNAVSVPFNSVVPFVERAGAVVGIRSGFLDVAGSAGCLKISLCARDNYKRSLVCHISDSFSLADMYREEKQYDLLYSLEEEEMIIKEIIERVTGELEDRKETGL